MVIVPGQQQAQQQQQQQQLVPQQFVAYPQTLAMGKYFRDRLINLNFLLGYILRKKCQLAGKKQICLEITHFVLDNTKMYTY